MHVKHALMDVNYPDMPMGGWAGAVKDVQGSDTLTCKKYTLMFLT